VLRTSPFGSPSYLPRSFAVLDCSVSHSATSPVFKIKDLRVFSCAHSHTGYKRGYNLPTRPMKAVFRGGAMLSHPPPFAILHDRTSSL